MAGINNSINFNGAVKPSSIEQDTYNAVIGAIQYAEVPNNLKMIADPAGRTDGQNVYQGYAVKGTLTSDARWLIYKFTFTGDFVTARDVGFGAWDNRATTVTYD